MEGLPADRAARVGAAGQPGARPGRRRHRGRELSAPGSGRRVLLWRHGQTTWNVERRFQGQTDIPLTESGVAQAQRAARLLAALEPDAIVSSDLARAANTAGELARLTGLSVTLDEGLRETYAGQWQGLTNREIEERYPAQFAAWRRGEPVRRGDGELEREVADRAVPA
ncbi:MAG: histidine phosphatase family protein, partial [Streptomycetaceae bacterium]|nr:histidine phosphatase family protein [Streptomycetaceae bacterium]